MENNALRKPEKTLTNQPKDAKIDMGAGVFERLNGAPTNLDNANSSAPTWAMSRDMITSNGCHVRLTFRKVSKPGVREEIARLLLASLEEKEWKS